MSPLEITLCSFMVMAIIIVAGVVYSIIKQ